MRERDWRKEITTLLDEYTENTSLPNCICSNPFDSKSVHEKLWKNKNICKIKSIWNWFKEKNITKEMFLLYIENLITNKSIEGDFFCVLLLGKYAPINPYFFHLFESIYVSEALPNNFLKFNSVDISPLVLYLIKKYYGEKKLKRIINLRQEILQNKMEFDNKEKLKFNRFRFI